MKYTLITISPIKANILDKEGKEVARVYSGGRNNWNIFGLLPGEFLTMAFKKQKVISTYCDYIDKKPKCQP